MACGPQLRLEEVIASRITVLVHMDLPHAGFHMTLSSSRICPTSVSFPLSGRNILDVEQQLKVGKESTVWS
jgi:hypothetical protein